jgi:hypothetical protein
MSWGAQNRSKDAKTPSAGRVMSRKPKPALCGIQPYRRRIVETEKQKGKKRTDVLGESARLRATPTDKEQETAHGTHNAYSRTYTAAPNKQKSSKDHKHSQLKTTRKIAVTEQEGVNK